MNDEQLMLDVKGGSSEAFTELFARYREPVYGFFRRRMADAARAEDLTQETFLAILRGAARYAPLAAFRSYLFGIAFNLLAAERRKTGHRNREEEYDEGQSAARPGADRDTGLWVRHAVAQLDPEHREALLLREYEQLSYSEIAELLKIPVNTVRSRLFRARMALKDLLVSK